MWARGGWLIPCVWVCPVEGTTAVAQVLQKGILQKGCVEDMWVRGWVSKPLQKGCVEDMWVRGWASKALQKGCVEDMWVRGWDSKQKGCVRVSNHCRRGLLRTCGSEGGC